MAKRYLTTVSKEEALRKVLAVTRPLQADELVPVPACPGRVTSGPVVAARSNPPFTSAAMDGYAVSFEETLDADVTSPVGLIEGKGAVLVNTGDPLPAAMNAVIMVEDVEGKEGRIVIRKPASLWQNVRLTGEDVIEGDMLFPVNYRFGILDVGLLLAGGVREVRVRRRPRLLIVPTGHELIDIYGEGGFPVPATKLIDFNSYTLMALGREMGYEVTKAEIARNNDDLRAVLRGHIPGHDVLVINAGSSAGTEDFTEVVIREFGEVLFHGVAMMPGKPTIFGLIEGKPVFGIPGYPVSAVISFRTFLGAVYERLVSSHSPEATVPCVIPYKLPSRIGVEEVLRVRLVAKDETYYAYPLPRGAGVFSSLSRADGLVTIPAAVEGYHEGSSLRAALLRPEGELADRINIVGSHDLSLDVLRDMIKTRRPAIDLVSAHVGSLSGIIAMQKGIIDLVTTHILDEREKVYNIPAIRRYLAERKVRLVHITKRIQGLLVAKGNPKGIRGVADLARPDVRFVNRQLGSGTRILLDMMLKERGIEAREIRGYDREESTHTAVALLVKEGIADTGLAIHAVSRIFSLDFIPLMEEEYDLIVTEEFAGDARFALLMELLASPEFASRLSSTI
ncbi:MAG: molybdopterin biosynthesis protein [Syntrophorhabdales bacterium]